MANTNTNPEVRFAGFTETWKERELSKILTERKVLQKISEDAPILAFAAGQGVIDRSERRSNNRDHLTHDQENKIYKLTELNDIVYNPSNLKYGAIDRNKHGRGVISPIYVTFTTEEEPSFVELLVKSEKFKLRALQYEEGTVVKRQSVKPENLLSLNVNISTSKEEQKRIGFLFKSLDNLINFHQQCYDKLVNIKETVLKKMFPVDEVNLPQIRFKGYNSDWAVHELSFFFDIIDGDRGENYPGESDFFESGQTLFLDTGNVKKDGFNFSTKKFITKEKDEDLGSGKLKLYDFILTSRGTLGNLAYYYDDISLTNPSVRVNSAMLILRPLQRKIVSDEYLLAVLRGETIVNFMSKNKAGSAQPHITKRDISKHRIAIPKDIEEQRKIGNAFKNLERLTALHQIEMKKLEEIKTACFEKLTTPTSTHFA
jgi:type I restriction enzyme S subunit